MKKIIKLILLFVVIYNVNTSVKSETLQQKCPNIYINSKIKYISYRVSHQVDLLGCEVLSFYKKFPENFELMDICEESQENMRRCIELSKIKDIEVLSNFPDIIKKYLENKIAKSFLIEAKEIAKIIKKRLSKRDYNNFREFMKYSFAYDKYYSKCSTLFEKINYAITCYKLMGANLFSEIKKYDAMVYFFPNSATYNIFKSKGYNAKYNIKKLNYSYIKSVGKIYYLFKSKYTKKESLAMISGCWVGIAYAVKTNQFQQLYTLVNFLIRNYGFQSIVKENKCDIRTIFLFLFQTEESFNNLINWFNYGKLKEILSKLDNEIKYSESPANNAWLVFIQINTLSNIYNKLTDEQKNIFDTLLTDNFLGSIQLNMFFVTKLYYETDYFNKIVRYSDYNDFVYINPEYTNNFKMYKFEAVLFCDVNGESIAQRFFKNNKFDDKLKEALEKNFKKHLEDFDLKSYKKGLVWMAEHAYIIDIIDYGSDAVFIGLDVVTLGAATPIEIAKKGFLKATKVMLKKAGRKIIKKIAERKIIKKIRDDLISYNIDKPVKTIVKIFASPLSDDTKDDNIESICQ